ncbi:MAG: DUF2807 domain-containing protein [Eudoraea sp.]|nr:DUF2807 domain-containing protein [Eudoraea sp.]
MRNYIILLAAICMSFTTYAQWGKKIKGNGEVVTIERSTEDYDGVAVSGWFDVNLVSGNEGNITIKGEENLLEYLITEVKKDKLVIRVKKGYYLSPSSWKSGGIEITVPVKEIRDVSLSGSGDIVGKTHLNADIFRASMSGSGDITLDIDANDLDVSLSGSGDINLKGSANELDISVSGSGDVKAYDLKAKKVDANVSGSADIKVTATEYLYAKVSGSGDIYYRGNAKVESKTSGSGDVTKTN